MSSWYDPPEDGDGCIVGPDFFITAQDDNDETEIVLGDLDHLLGSADNRLETEEIKSLAKDGVEVYVRWGYSWAMDEKDTWYYAVSHDAADDAITRECERHMESMEDARVSAYVEEQMEARHRDK
tara:strand:+ start:554 stop:928 length:375 start_codon:yes stop_codon:yes gene_type:complete